MPAILTLRDLDFVSSFNRIPFSEQMSSGEVEDGSLSNRFVTFQRHRHFPFHWTMIMAHYIQCYRYESFSASLYNWGSLLKSHQPSSFFWGHCSQRHPTSFPAAAVLNKPGICGGIIGVNGTCGMYGSTYCWSYCPYGTWRPGPGPGSMHGSLKKRQNLWSSAQLQLGI